MNYKFILLIILFFQVSCANQTSNKKIEPKILIISVKYGYFSKTDIKTYINKITKVVYPKPTPRITGIVFLIPKLKAEYDATALFGPGANPKEKEIPINNNNSGFIQLCYWKTVISFL